MSEMINFGIDLGTTNSLIAKFDHGIIEVFRNPNGFKETLPSIVGFRKERILVGDQARAYAQKDPDNVKSRFKRKMGTTECFRVESLGQLKTPVELSAYILKELKTFIHTGETPKAVVITIPASFDMLQSNATTEAGYAAGFKQVVLLQEPIAASLAYANKEKGIDLKNSQWIVYDLGGGTFDVALVRIVEGELKIVDHEGDNYLGGGDFDALIVQHVIVPWLEAHGKFSDLLSEMTKESGIHNRLWFRFLEAAERAKIELSAKSSTQIEIEVEDDEGNSIEGEINITRSEFESIIKSHIDSTATMLKTILTRNSLQPQDLKFVLMVGGSTYIPFIRRRIGELLGIPVNTGIDPTNAIAIGAAYFAATREIKIDEQQKVSSNSAGTIKVKTGFSPASQELEEIFSAKLECDVTGLYYRITRNDGGYDSGLKKLTSRINEDLPLQANAYNSFAFKIYDNYNNPVPTDFSTFQIAQGIYHTAGQQVPQDICLVLDDKTTGDTTLECIFERNTILGGKPKTLNVEARITVPQGSKDKIEIIVVQGPSENHHAANLEIGRLTITGKDLKRDLIRGTDVELKFDLSESSSLSVSAFINPSGPELKKVFTLQNRDVDVDGLQRDVHLLEDKIDKEMTDATANENYEVADRLKKLNRKVQSLLVPVLRLEPDDVTDEKFKLEKQKRDIAQELSQMTAGKPLDISRAMYNSVKESVTEIVSESGNDLERRRLSEIVASEPTFWNSKDPRKIERAIDDLENLKFAILYRTPQFLVSWFDYLVEKREIFNDQVQSKSLIEAGKRYIATEDYDDLLMVNRRLHSLLPRSAETSQEAKHYTGITAG